MKTRSSGSSAGRGEALAARHGKGLEHGDLPESVVLRAKSNLRAIPRRRAERGAGVRNSQIP
jgi:hypothetical protein